MTFIAEAETYINKAITLDLDLKLKKNLSDRNKVEIRQLKFPLISEIQI